MKRTTLAFVMTALLTSLCAVPAASQALPSTGAVPQQYLPPMPEKAPFSKKLDEMMKSREVFEKALYEDDLQTIQSLLKKFPGINNLKMKMEYVTPSGIRGLESYPICIAADYGHTKIMKYMAEQDPFLMSLHCTTYNEDGPLDRLVLMYPENEGIFWFLSHGFKVKKDMLARIASRDLDTKTWKKLIPALLDGGAEADAKTERGSGEGDALYSAGLSKKDNFITVFRAELKKRNLPVVAHYTFIQCPGGGGNVSMEAKYLKERGIPLEVNHVTVYYDCD